MENQSDLPKTSTPISAPPTVKSFSPNFILIFITLVSLLLTGYFTYQNRLLQQRLAAIESTQMQNLGTPTPKTTPSDETADWKTFKNGKYSFQINLPASWREVEHSSNFDYIFPFAAPDKSQFQIMVATPVPTSLEEYLKKIDQESNTAWEGQPSKKVISVLVTTRAGYPAILRKEDWLAAGFTTFSTYIKVDNRVYVFTILPYGDKPLVEQETYDKNLQILESFKSPLP